METKFSFFLFSRRIRDLTRYPFLFFPFFLFVRSVRIRNSIRAIRVIFLLIVTRIEGTATSVANTKGIRTRVWPDTSRSTYRDRGNCEEKKRARISIDFLPREINYRLIYNDICDRSNERMVGSEAL